MLTRKGGGPEGYLEGSRRLTKSKSHYLVLKHSLRDTTRALVSTFAPDSAKLGGFLRIAKYNATISRLSRLTFHFSIVESNPSQLQRLSFVGFKVIRQPLLLHVANACVET